MDSRQAKGVEDRDTEVRTHTLPKDGAKQGRAWIPATAGE